jgi:phospholipid transport system transporter-binding protein
MPMRIEATSITNATAGELLAEGTAAIARGEVDFDLSAVTEIDTAAIALLLDWQRQALARGSRLRLSGVPADIASLAELYGVDELLHLDGQRPA